MDSAPPGAGAVDALAPALLKTYGSPLYVYDETILRARCRALRDAVPLDGVRMLYAAKANTNPAILRTVRDEGLDLDAVSLGEVLAALRAGFPAMRLSYNGNNVADDELSAVLERGVHVSVDALSQLERVARLKPGASVGLRLNPDVGDGHHEHVITGGPDAKFGVAPADIPAARRLAAERGLRLDGLHQHIGSGILDVENLLRAVDVMLETAAQVPGLAFVDFGGGFGVPYRPGERALDVAAFGAAVAPRLAAFRRAAGSDVAFRFEPGRFVVAECGTLLVVVTAVKRTAKHVFVGVDSGFHHLVRPTLYGAYHPVRNLTRPDAPPITVRVAGNICESGDLLAKDRLLPEPREGDVLAIDVAGAYGYSMSSNYNTRPRPAEVMIGVDGAPRLIRRRETFEDLARTEVAE
ncbi:MAG TPA: diaminopimelate decarboxylase [Planctomycetota bacterium]|nr:diaminopimelate decarboxylase [Planctomycetota bacterium]